MKAILKYNKYGMAWHDEYDERIPLLPCPFCGATNPTYYMYEFNNGNNIGVAVYCQNSQCGAQGPDEKLSDYQSVGFVDLDLKWNKRVKGAEG